MIRGGAEHLASRIRELVSKFRFVAVSEMPLRLPGDPEEHFACWVRLGPVWRARARGSPDVVSPTADRQTSGEGCCAQT
jgi:hypothetical protein